MKRHVGFSLPALLIVFLLSACKLSIISFTAPDTVRPGSTITVIVYGFAEDIEDGANEHGVVLQIPESWQVISSTTDIDRIPSLEEKPEYEALYTAEAGYKVLVGTSSQVASGNLHVTVTIQIEVGDLDDNAGDGEYYTLKACVGVLRDDVWVTDDPAGKFDFSLITDDKYVEIIEVTNIPACMGDFDNDGDVDGSDLAMFASHFGRTDCPDFALDAADSIVSGWESGHSTDNDQEE